MANVSVFLCFTRASSESLVKAKAREPPIWLKFNVNATEREERRGKAFYLFLHFARAQALATR